MNDNNKLQTILNQAKNSLDFELLKRAMDRTTKDYPTLEPEIQYELAGVISLAMSDIFKNIQSFTFVRNDNGVIQCKLNGIDYTFHTDGDL